MAKRKNNQTPKAGPRQFSIEGTANIGIEAAAEGAQAKRPTIEIELYNGGAMVPNGWPLPVVIDLEGMEVANSVPILLDHDHTAILGQSNKITVTKSSVKVKGTITGDDEHSDKVLTHSKNGFVWGASAGAEVSKLEFVATGSTAKANGKTFKGPLYMARASRLRESTVTAVGADHTAKTSIAARAAGVDSMEFSAWLKANGFGDEDSITDAKQLKALKAAWQASIEASDEPTGDDPPVDGGGEGGKAKKKPVTVAASGNNDDGDGNDPIAAHRKAVADDTRRIAAIRKLCNGEHDDIEAKAIEAGWSQEKVELEVLRASRNKPQISTTRSGAPGGEVAGKALEASLCISAGLTEKSVGEMFPAAEREKVMNAAASPAFRGASIQSLLRATIEASGEHVGHGGFTDATIRRAFEADRKLRASGFSTISLPNTLANVANKMLLESFLSVESVAPRLAAQTDVRDFKTFYKNRITGKGSFQSIGADGSLKAIELSEEQFSNQLTTRGMILTLTRQMIYNDDLGAFTQIPRIIGRQAAIALEKAFFTLLLSNPSNFFHADNRNLISGGTSVLGVDGLTLLLTKFLKQLDSNNDPVMVAPKMLLVSPENKIYAERLYKESRVNETTTADKAKPGDNPHAGKYEPICSPYLSTTSLTGYSTTAYYLWADPADLAAMEIAYLQGKRQPTIESADTDFETLGMQFRGFWDFGIGMQDFRAAAKSAGA